MKEKLRSIALFFARINGSNRPIEGVYSMIALLLVSAFAGFALWMNLIFVPYWL